MVFFFFFKQKTAYEISACLVGSEMCIRDRVSTQSTWGQELYIKIKIMASATKLAIKGREATQIENEVGKALREIENASAEFRDGLKNVVVNRVREVEITRGDKDRKKCLLVYVPFPVLNNVQNLQRKLQPELEKKLKNQTVLIVGSRRIMSKWIKANRSQKRPRSRTLTSVYDALLDDLIHPASVIGRRIRYRTDGSSFQKIYVDANDRDLIEHRVEAIQQVYKALTTRNIVIEFKAETLFHKA
eukprot:TRINITY_DN23_c0_g1_i2.p1 TRINITY_DN23_c0_g1~~TRINITY_DN23_c0_g1_i2.p1  ORF type:complete len:245 (-),score=90.57 TRINITY_DN23_c0_g1_i2:89-823(-)